MRILKLKEDVEALGGSERCMLVATDGLRSLGHSVHLAHGREDSANTARFSGTISLPVLFDRAPIVERAAVRHAYRALRTFIADHDIDVVHLHTYPRTAIMHRLVRDVAVVVTPHNASCPNKARFLWAERMPCERDIGLGCVAGYMTKGCGHLGNGQPIGPPGFLRAMVEDRHTRVAIGRCHRVVAGSTWMAHYLAATGTPAERVRVVEPPITVVASNGVATASPAGAGTAGQPPVVTFVGRLVTIKGADHVLRASARLGVDHRVAIAGDGVDRPALEGLASQLGITDRVDFLGRMDAGELEALRRRSAVVVVPALSPEVFGMVGPEALALGVPVVAYAVGGTNDWLRAGAPLAAGVDVGDLDGLVARLRQVLEHPPTGDDRALVAAAMRYTLSPARHAARLAEVYGEARELYANRPVRRVGRVPVGASTRHPTVAPTAS